MFEWQHHTQSQVNVPPFQDLLDFIDSRAQASESSIPLKKFSKWETSNLKRSFPTSKPVTSFTASHESASQCVLCKPVKHPLYACPKFKSLSHEGKLSTVKAHNICVNCLMKGHFTGVGSAKNHITHYYTQKPSQDQNHLHPHLHRMSLPIKCHQMLL